MNQDITFLSDGGDTVHDLQLYLSPQAEHLLDWFHITMRLTVMRQMTKGLSSSELFLNLETELDRVKWYLWHGNVFRALQVLDEIEMDLEIGDDSRSRRDKLSKLTQEVREFYRYIEGNRPFIPNYGEPISSAFVESTINEVVSKRMVKKQQMRCTKRGAHLLLQIRTQTLNADLKATFGRWYPAMPHTEPALRLAA